MKVIIGSYRGPEMVYRCLQSLHRHVGGVTQLVIVDDSGNDEWSDEYRNWPFGTLDIEVISTHKRGYNHAMKVVCDNAGGQRFMFLEEDFTFEADVDLELMDAVLVEFPDLAQLALLRGPHFPIEYQYGGVLEALQKRLPMTVIDRRESLVVGDVIVQDGTFTCNPAVWQTGVSSRGWPDGKWSEDRMRDQLLARGYLFGFLPGIKVKHDGERSGFDY